MCMAAKFVPDLGLYIILGAARFLSKAECSGFVCNQFLVVPIIVCTAFHFVMVCVHESIDKTGNSDGVTHIFSYSSR